MDRCIVTVVLEKDACIARDTVVSNELSPNFKYEIWYDLGIKKWKGRTILKGGVDDVTILHHDGIEKGNDGNDGRESD